MSANLQSGAVKTPAAPACPSTRVGRPCARSLADAYPALSPTWHSGRNGSLTPDRIAPQSSFNAWWRCSAGHEWQEKVAQRPTMPKWKNGDVAAPADTAQTPVSRTPTRSAGAP
ncbi:zinc-ribbon domain-containing protein [Kitasatospora sp. NPDC085895]|uniref:zinc-ribbon domain-containing protein n=1 Tax=Kitasatospora sp. NPDC085895 TaxID=3155057 RepID=UPI00344CA0AD